MQVGSALAYRAIPLQAAYCGAKHALRGFTDSLRCELMNERSNVSITMVQLPGLNTPQFDLGASARPAQDPRPVPPVYRPEMQPRRSSGPREHKRREVWVGGSTVATILGNKVVPKLADLYLARTNIKGQQTGEEISADRRDYLFDAGRRRPGRRRSLRRRGEVTLLAAEGNQAPAGASERRRCGGHRHGAVLQEAARTAWGGACASTRPATSGGRTRSSTASTSRPSSTPTATASATSAG